MEIDADKLELFGDDYQNIKASGNVSGKNLETNMDFSCDLLEFDRTTKIALLQGNVNLKDNDNDVEAAAQIIEYDQNTEIAVLQIDINLKQENNVCSSSYAVYYKNEQLLELSGNAQVKKDSDTFRAQFISFNMETQDITLGGNVKGSVTDKKESPIEKDGTELPENFSETEGSALSENPEETKDEDSGKKEESTETEGKKTDSEELEGEKKYGRTADPHTESF